MKTKPIEQFTPDEMEVLRLTLAAGLRHYVIHGRTGPLVTDHQITLAEKLLRKMPEPQPNN